MDNLCDIYRGTVVGKAVGQYDGGSLVIRSFTGSGKTLFVLCEVLRWALENGYRVVYTTGLRSAVREFLEKASALYGEGKVGYVMGVDIAGSRFESEDKDREWRKPIVVSTYEQAVMRFMRGESRDVLVIDEYHNVLTDFRKYKLLFLLAVARMKKIPTIIMSATMPDKEFLAKYLNAKLIDIGSNWDNKDVTTMRLPSYKPKVLLKYIRGIVSSRSGIGERGIVYINSRRLCKELGDELGIPCITGEMSEARKQEVLDKLRKNEVRWLIATSTLAESINEPFDDVVIVVNSLTSPFEITQMAGRAGRFSGGAVVFILYPIDFEVCVKRALDEKYGKITVSSEDYPNLVAAYAELVSELDLLRNVIRETYGVNEDPDQVIKTALYYKVVDVKGDKVIPTRIGKWMNRFLAKYEEYQLARDCMAINKDPHAAWFCYTITTTGRGFPILSDEMRDKYREQLTKLFGRDPFKVPISLPPYSVYRSVCGDAEFDIMDLVDTYNISLSVGDWLVYITTGLGKKYSVYFELPYTRQKLEALGLGFDDGRTLKINNFL